MKCPVCQTECLENSQFCSVCAWEFKIYVSDISEQEQKLYSQKLQIAQNNWNELNAFKNKVNTKEKQNQKPNSAKGIKTELKPDTTPNEIKTTDLVYSAKTAVPELNRDPFETFEEFEARINNYPPVPSGKVKLVKKDFSFHIGEFPVEINWEEWTQNIKDLPSKEQRFSIHVSPEIAQDFYQSNESHTLFIKLKSAEKESALDGLAVFWNDQVFSIHHYTVFIKPLKNETETDYKNRILSYNDIPVGEGSLIKEKYDITTGTFPIELKIDQWVNDNFEITINNPYIIANRDIARDIYEHSRVYPIKARLKVNWYGGVAIENFYLSAKKMSFEIENLKNLDPISQMEFIYVPGGTFQMGDLFGDDDDNEKPVHEVALDNFYIAKYPVTQGQWKAIMNNNPSKFKKGDNYPVEQVSWNDVQEFIKKINGMYISKYVLRLPTEAEWEYAARSGGKNEQYAGFDNIDELAWYSNNSNNTTQPVGKKRPNTLGLYDMSGNVWEWCADNYFDKAYSKHAKTNPIYLKSTSGSRVLRGGAWNYDARYCRASCRYWNGPSLRNSNIGFRLVSSPRSVI